MHYSYSTGLNNLVSQAKLLLSYWIFRYKLISDNSERGQDCPYARQALRLSNEAGERETIKTLLISMRAQIDALLDADETSDNE
jgi:hypothetical protein